MNEVSNNPNLKTLLNYFEQGNFQKVIVECNQLINSGHKSYILYSLMGASYDAMNCKDEAILSYNKSININKNICETYFNVANIYLKKLDYNQAIKNYKKAIFLNKNYSTAYNNLGIAYIEKKDLINAQKVLEDLVNINPNYSQGICNLATVFLQKDDHEKALSYYELAMTCNNSPKEKIEIQKNLSLCQLKMENFKEGWKNYKSRVHSDGYISISNLPLFKLNSSFKNVIILPEQGIGDEIFFSRFFNDLKKLDKKFYYLCSEKIFYLFKKSFPHIIFLNKKKFIEDKKYQIDCIKNYSFDSQLYIGDIASFFIFENKNIINRSKKFLKTNKFIPNNLKNNLPKNKIICGLSWISQNNQTSIHAKNKQDLSTSLTKLKSLLHLDNLNFIDLNYVDTTDERIKFYNDFGVKIKKFKQIDSLNKLDELASLINICDLIISVSNTTAHLSAALGKKTFLLLPEKNKKIWYWNSNFFRSHWYNSMQIYENYEENNFKEIINKLNNE